MKRLFIAGTDTGVGKTHVSINLLNNFKNMGLATIALKPLASGCVQQKNADAVALQQAATIHLPYTTVNPFAFEPPVAPHIAATLSNKNLNAATIAKTLAASFTIAADICLIEGVGGWHTPLNSNESMADVVIKLKLPTILVVGIRLGCLNHAMLTYRAMQQDGANLIGWIANCLSDDMPYSTENIEYLKQWLPVPCLAVNYFKQT